VDNVVDGHHLGERAGERPHVLAREPVHADAHLSPGQGDAQKALIAPMPARETRQLRLFLPGDFIMEVYDGTL
jgi:hypothetical protein